MFSWTSFTLSLSTVNCFWLWNSKENEYNIDLRRIEYFLTEIPNNTNLTTQFNKNTDDEILAVVNDKLNEFAFLESFVKNLEKEDFNFKYRKYNREEYALNQNLQNLLNLNFSVVEDANKAKFINFLSKEYDNNDFLKRLESNIKNGIKEILKTTENNEIDEIFKSLNEIVYILTNPNISNETLEKEQKNLEIDSTSIPKIEKIFENLLGYEVKSINETNNTEFQDSYKFLISDLKLLISLVNTMNTGIVKNLKKDNNMVELCEIVTDNFEKKILDDLMKEKNSIKSMEDLKTSLVNVKNALITKTTMFPKKSCTLNNATTICSNDLIKCFFNSIIINSTAGSIEQIHKVFKKFIEINKEDVNKVMINSNSNMEPIISAFYPLLGGFIEVCKDKVTNIDLNVQNAYIEENISNKEIDTKLVKSIEYIYDAKTKLFHYSNVLRESKAESIDDKKKELENINFESLTAINSNLSNSSLIISILENLLKNLKDLNLDKSSSYKTFMSEFQIIIDDIVKGTKLEASVTEQITTSIDNFITFINDLQNTQDSKKHKDNLKSNLSKFNKQFETVYSEINAFKFAHDKKSTTQIEAYESIIADLWAIKLIAEVTVNYFVLKKLDAEIEVTLPNENVKVTDLIAKVNKECELSKFIVDKNVKITNKNLFTQQKIQFNDLLNIFSLMVNKASSISKKTPLKNLHLFNYAHQKYLVIEKLYNFMIGKFLNFQLQYNTAIELSNEATSTLKSKSDASNTEPEKPMFLEVYKHEALKIQYKQIKDRIMYFKGYNVYFKTLVDVFIQDMNNQIENPEIKQRILDLQSKNEKITSAFKNLYDSFEKRIQEFPEFKLENVKEFEFKEFERVFFYYLFIFRKNILNKNKKYIDEKANEIKNFNTENLTKDDAKKLSLILFKYYTSVHDRKDFYLNLNNSKSFYDKYLINVKPDGLNEQNYNQVEKLINQEKSEKFDEFKEIRDKIKYDEIVEPEINLDIQTPIEKVIEIKNHGKQSEDKAQKITEPNEKTQELTEFQNLLFRISNVVKYFTNDENGREYYLSEYYLNLLKKCIKTTTDYSVFIVTMVIICLTLCNLVLGTMVVQKYNLNETEIENENENENE